MSTISDAMRKKYQELSEQERKVTMTIEALNEKLTAMYTQYQEEADNTTGDEEKYAQGQLAMLEMVIDMLEENV